MHDLEADIRKSWQSICWKMNRGDVCNFQASIDLFSGDVISSEDEVSAIKQILGSQAKPEFIEVCDMEKMLLRVRDDISWNGDEGAFPNRKYLFASDFNTDLEDALAKLRRLLKDATGFWEFVLVEGHPFYPVFWEFSFLIKSPDKNYIFIGSSSD